MQQTFVLQNKASPVIMQHPCIISISKQSTATHGPIVFPHASKCDNARGRTHALCPLANQHLLQWLLSPHRSLQAAILVLSPIITLSQWLSLLATITLHETHALVFWHCLHPCRPHALSPFKFIQQSTSLLNCLVGKKIGRVILFEWVILFKKTNSSGFDR